MVFPTRLCRAFAPYQLKLPAALKTTQDPITRPSIASLSPLLLAALERAESAEGRDDSEGALMSSNPPSPLSSAPSSPLSSAPSSPLSLGFSSPLSSPPPSPELPSALSLPPPLSHLMPCTAASPSILSPAENASCTVQSVGKAERARQKCVSAKRRKLQRVRAATGQAPSKPYRPKPSALKRHEILATAAVHRAVKQLPVASGGAWVGRRLKEELDAPRDIGNLLKLGFTIHSWDGRTPEVFIDPDGVIITVLAGRPNDPGWDGVANGAADALRRFRERGVRGGAFRTEDLDHRRGRFLAVAAGVSYGGGQKRPGNLCHSRWRRRLLSIVLSDINIRRIAGFQSSVFAFYAPKAYAYAAKTLAALFASQSKLLHNFKNSIFPAVSLNCGPQTECEKHVDSGNAPLIYCAITALGRYNPKTGGHIILYPLKKIIEFPPGSSILIPSASVPHGNTPIQPGETRMSLTQYCAGGLLRWVEYGFRSGKALLAERDGKVRKLEIDGVGMSRWEWALGLFSKAAELVGDRARVFNL